MKSFFKSLPCLAVLFFAYYCTTTFAIYDPRETKPVKPPKRREFVIPWYLSRDTRNPTSDSEFYGQDESIDSISRIPTVVHDGGYSHTPRFESTQGEIEQQTITSFNDGQSQEVTRRNFDLQPSTLLVQPYSNTVQRYDENGWFEDNDGFQKPYEVFAIEIKKPYKDTKDSTSEPVKPIKIAKYDTATGAQCPTSDATGQFVYPPDCKFFVNCWNGRAFLQPCAPGTLFNPETLECDFPFKVTCYGTELEGLTNLPVVPPIKKQPLSTSSQGQWRITQPDEKPTCPPWETGLLPHPYDCTKYLQCANGGTFIRDCGPGTVFNPVYSVCDWPYNVKGCEDALRPELETTTISFLENIDLRSNFQKASFHSTVQPEVVKCPDGEVGLLRHPNDCRKFLQCSHGNTFVMDCGPGTVFNPIISVCDFPYNVEGCNEDKPTVTESSDSGINPSAQSFGRGDLNGEGSRQENNFNYNFSPSNKPNENRRYDDQNYNHGIAHKFPNANRNQDNNNGNWNPSYGKIPNRGQSDDSDPSYSHVTEHSFTPHREIFNDNNQNIYVDSNFKLPGEDETQSENENSEGGLPDPDPTWNYVPETSTPKNLINHGNWNQKETHVDQPGRFKPSPWRGQDEERQRPSNPVTQHPWNQDTSSGKSDPPGNYETQDLEIDSKLDEWAMKTNVFHEAHNRPGIKTDRQGKKYSITTNLANHNQNSMDENNRKYYPNGIYNNEHGIKGHFITKEIEINQGHSNTRQYGNNYPVDNLESRNEYHTTEKNSLHDAIEFENNDESLETSNVTNVLNTTPDSSIVTEDRVVDENSEDENREPKSISSNKTTNNSITSGIMKINSEKIDLDLFGIELVRDKDEPPFPNSYIPPVQPIDYTPEDVQSTPISGLVLRLRGGSGPGEGYLEVQGSQPGWGIVCDERNEWNLKKANIVCRQLGYTRGAESAWQGQNTQGVALTWVAANSVKCVGNETYFQSCEFTDDSPCDIARDAVGIRCLPNAVAYCRKDEIPHRGFCYHLADADTALNHAEALNYCENKGSKLLDIIDQNENNFISELLVQNYPEINSVMTSGFGFKTWNRTLWLWEDSQHAKFKFAKWWPGWMNDKQIPPSIGTRPACVVMKRNFPCHNRPDETCFSDYFFWDAEDCAASSKGHSYVCKRAYNDIGCVYGKGNHYSGNANVTASGTQCLSWGDESIQHYLSFKVVSQEIREKLQTHNYCRNPNPKREIKPWCYTGSNGEYDYCDIPLCAKQGSPKSPMAGQCKPKHFECTPGECIPSPWICDGEEDCTNGADEQACLQNLEFYTKIERHRLDGYDVEKWLNTPVKTCALRCKEADFTCRSFSHKEESNVCLLSDSNIGITGALQPSENYDYYEMNERSLDCSEMFVCGNKKCINESLVCDGKNHCGDRSDETICDAKNLGYEIRLSGSDNSEEGRVEVKAWGHWGQVCDDGFGMIAANIACKELGFTYGAREVRSPGFYGKGESTLFMMDQVKCRGNETSLRECDFDGWGIHNCLAEEAVGIVCKTAVDICPDGSWKCDNSPECILSSFICDEVVDCSDGSDEGPQHCQAPFELRLSGGSNDLEGRVEVRHHGVWGTVCDDDFSTTIATVICRSLGYGGSAIAVKNGAFGPGEGPIWLDGVSCSGNETQLYKCDHEPWGQHNCDHKEDAGIRCEPGEVIVHTEPNEQYIPDLPEIEINDILPADCGKRVEDFDENDEYMARVVRGSIAPKGAYPWQASLRIRGYSRSSHWCGAVIISPLHVLTAAHCLKGYNKGMYSVRAGDYNTEVDDGTEVEAFIEDYYIHEDFGKGQNMNNDIALVLLKGRGIPLGRNIMPICLPPENVEYLPGLNCTISGWGSTRSGTSVASNFLRFGWVPILDQSVCRAEYVYGEGAISDGMVCAGFLNEGVDTCDGDSGGPLACYHNNAFTLYGLTSWGKRCGEPNRPGVYVRIAHYRNWIDRKIQESSSGR